MFKKSLKKRLDYVILTLLFIFAVSIFLLHHHVVGFTIYNDGIGYYLYLRSAFFDHDLDFSNELEFYHNSYSKVSNISRGEIYFPKTINPNTGYAVTLYTIGSSIMWIPFFLSAHILTKAANLLGFEIAANGYTIFYEILIGIANLVYGLLALIIIYKFCKKFYKERTALLSVISMWLGTAVLWYMVIEPSMSHITSMFLISCFIYVWYFFDSKKVWKWALFGLVGGLMFLVRMQNVLFFIIPGLDLLIKYLKAIKMKRVKQFKTLIFQNFIFIIAFLASILPQVIIWKIMFGEYVVNQYAGSIWFFAPFKNMLGLIFSANGMIRMPIIPISLIGLCLLVRKREKISIYFMMAFLLQFLMISSWSGWDTGYLLRFFIECTPLLGLGLCETIEWFDKKKRFSIITVILILLIIFNFINMVLYI